MSNVTWVACGLVAASMILAKVWSKVASRRFLKRKSSFSSVLRCAEDMGFGNLSRVLQRLRIIKVFESGEGNLRVEINTRLLSTKRRGLYLVDNDLALISLGSILHARPDDEALWQQVASFIVDESHRCPKNRTLAIETMISLLARRHNEIFEPMKTRCKDLVSAHQMIDRARETAHQIRRAGGDPDGCAVELRDDVLA